MPPKVGYVTIENIYAEGKWCKNEYGHISNALSIANMLADSQFPTTFLGPLPNPRLISQLKSKIYNKLSGKRLLPQFESSLLKRQADHIGNQANKNNIDVLLGNTTRPFAALRTKLPIIVWRDSTFAGALEVHRDFANTSARSIKLGHETEKAALENCRLALFRSQWAADSAINDYDIDPAKVHVLRTGGNIKHVYPREQISEIVSNRSEEICELLFIGVNWKMKGGDTVVEIAQRLVNTGLKVRLTIVGDKPPVQLSLPSNTVVTGFIDICSDSGRKMTETLFSRSHFLLFPSRVDTYGNVLAEATAFGVPCLASKQAGIPSIIRDGINGHLIPTDDQEIDGYCEYIEKHMQHYDRYSSLALSAYDEYRSTLAWDIIRPQLAEFIKSVST